MIHARHLVAVTLATLAPLAAMRAQTSAGDARAFAALRASHIGALNQIVLSGAKPVFGVNAVISGR